MNRSPIARRASTVTARHRRCSEAARIYSAGRGNPMAALVALGLSLAIRLEK